MVATSADREKFEITERFFADDSKLIGWTNELKLGKEVVKQAMKDYEENCHNGKEEPISFGTEAANKTRMLGTRIGRKDDLKARVQLDCTVHTWTATDIQEMQSVPDNAYRWIWNHNRGLAKLRMQKEHVNAYEIRGQL